MVCSDEEHAIFIINWREKEKLDKNFYVYGSGVNILIEFLVKKNVKFKIYNCLDPDFFIEAIKKSKAQSLWIFAHGDRHGIDFGGNGGYVPFCKLAGTHQRKFIAQLHCSHLTGETMWEYLSNKPGIFYEGMHSAIQNRELINEWIQKNE